MASIWDMLVTLGLDSSQFQSGIQGAAAATQGASASMASGIASAGTQMGATLEGVTASSVRTSSSFASLGSSSTFVAESMNRGMGRAGETFREFSRTAISSMTGIPPQIAGIAIAMGGLGVAIVGVIGLLQLLGQAFDTNLHSFGKSTPTAPGVELGYVNAYTGGQSYQSVAGSQANSGAQSASTGGYATSNNLIDYDRLGRVFKNSIQQAGV